MPHWETHDGVKLHYCDVTATEVVVGQNAGTPSSDSAGVCSHEQFLAGQLQSALLSGLGEAVLLEVIAAVGGSEADRKAFPPHLRQRQALVIPVGVTSKKREHWDRYGEAVSRNFQPVPHFDALAPSLADMVRCTPLTRAIQTMSEYLVLKHLDELEPHGLDGNGASPLNVALLHTYGGELIQALIDRGASVNSPDGNGVYPLEVAITAQIKPHFKLLKRAKVDAQRRLASGRSYLHWAVERRCTSSLSPLKQLKVDLNATDDQGQTALHYSVFNGMTEPLIKMKVDPELRDHYGERALDLALRGAFAHRVSYLSVEGSYKDKEALYEVTDGLMTMRVKGGKPRKLKLDVERSLARKVSPDHLAFLRYVEACVSLCKLSDLSLTSFAGVPALQLIADLQRPEFDKPLSKRGLTLPPPRAVSLSCAAPQRPSTLL